MFGRFNFVFNLQILIVSVVCFWAGRTSFGDQPTKPTEQKKPIFWNTLDSKQAIYKSRIGAGGVYRGEGGEFVDGIVGKALQLKHDEYEAVAFPKDAVPTKAGCIEFWAKMTGLPVVLQAGQRPALIQVFDGKSAYGIHFNANDGFSNGGLCGWAGHGGHCGTGRDREWRYEELLEKGNAGEWHHYALVWDEKGLSGAAKGKTFAVFLDGKLNTGSWRNNDGTEFPPLTGGELKLHVKHTSIGQGAIAYDELKIWDYARTDCDDELAGRIQNGLKFTSRAEAAEALKKHPDEAVEVLRLRKEYLAAKIDCTDLALLALYKHPYVAKKATKQLREMLAGKHQDAQRMAAMVLSLAGEDDAPVITALINGLKHPTRFDEMGGRGAARELAALGKKAIPALIEFRAFSVLGDIGPQARDAIPTLTEGLRDNDARQRIAAALAFYKIAGDSKQALPVLIAGLTDKDWRVRLQAARAVGELGSNAKSAEAAVKKLLDDEKDLVRRAAKQSLEHVSARSFYYDSGKGTLPQEKGFRQDYQAYGGTDVRAKSPFRVAKQTSRPDIPGRLTSTDKNVRAPDESLVLHYTFDRARKNDVEPDESDHGNNAKIHGAAWRKDGRIGGAMEFDGKDDWLDCGNNKSVNFGSSDFTAALWFKTSLEASSRKHGYNTFLNKGSAGSLTPARPGYGIYATSEHGKTILRWDFGQRSHVGRARVITDQWQPDRWNHVTLVRRGKTIEAYLNGKRVTKQVQKATSDLSVSGREPLLLGKVIGNNGTTYLYQGLLDDVRIYNRALSGKEIALLHNDVVGQSVSYDPSRGTQPTEQGFRLLDNTRGHANPQVIDGVLKQGPTTTQGYQRWYTAAAIPIDFSAEGQGTAVEWTAQVKRSGLYIDRSHKREWTGWGVQLQDRHGHTFDIYLGEDRVLLNRDDGNTPIAVHKLDTTDRFHHYRFVIDDSQGKLFIDGSSEPALAGKVGAPNQSRYSKPNEVAFGDSTTHALSEVHLKGLWYASNARAKSPFYPEPQTALFYNASHGTLPSEQNFQLIDDESGHGAACVEQGAMVDGPTTTKGARYWQSYRIPLDFRPQGTGLSAEWKIQVVDSSVDATGRYSGWSAAFVDQFGHQFVIGLGNERIVLNNETGDLKPAFARFNTTDSPHHFRFVVDDNQGTLYVDGKRLLSKPLGTPDKRKILVNRVLFGDGTGLAGAHTKLWVFGYAADAGATFRSLATKLPIKITGCEDFDWAIKRTNCDGWEFENTDGELKLTKINAAVASTTTRPIAPWATVELSHALSKVHDFTLEAEISWDAPSVRAMRRVTIELAGSEGRIASVSHNDSWYDFRGNRLSYLNDKSVQSPYNTELLSGSATLTLMRSDGETRILWDGKPLPTGISGRPLDRVNLTFGYYPYDGARKSVFGTVTVHRLSLKTPEAERQGEKGSARRPGESGY